MPVNLSPAGGAASQFFGNDGVPLSGGFIFTYAAGSTTPLASYTTAQGNIQHSNPINLDAAGRVPGGEIWLTAGLGYKFVLKDSTNNVIGTYDNLSGINGTGTVSDATNVQYTPPFSGAVATTVAAKLGLYMSVQDFGAVGNGIADDTAEIQAALNFCFNNGGGVVYVPPGTYKTTSPLIVRTNTALMGSGPGTIILGTGGSGSPTANVIHIGYGYEWNQNGQYFNPGSNDDATLAQLLAYNYTKITTSNVCVSNLTIQSNSNGLGIWTLNAQNVQINNIWAVNNLTPINIANDFAGWQAACHNINVSDIFQVTCNGLSDWYDLVFVGSATDIVINRCFNNSNTPSALSESITASYANGVTISNCVLSQKISGSKQGILHTGQSLTTPANTNLVGNTIKNYNNGITAFDASSVNIVGNVLENNDIGLRLLAKNCLVVGNNFLNNTTDITGTSDTTGNIIQNNRLITFINPDIAFESYNSFKDNDTPIIPLNNRNTYGPLYYRKYIFTPYEGFTSAADLSDITERNTRLKITAGTTVTLLYKIPQNFKKINSITTYGYADAAGEIIQTQIVGYNDPVNDTNFSYSQNVGTLTTGAAGDFAASYTVASPSLYMHGGYYIAITVTFADADSQLRSTAIVALSDS